MGGAGKADGAKGGAKGWGKAGGWGKGGGWGTDGGWGGKGWSMTSLKGVISTMFAKGKWGKDGKARARVSAKRAARATCCPKRGSPRKSSPAPSRRGKASTAGSSQLRRSSTRRPH